MENIKLSYMIKNLLKETEDLNLQEKKSGTVTFKQIKQATMKSYVDYAGPADQDGPNFLKPAKDVKDLAEYIMADTGMNMDDAYLFILEAIMKY